MTKTFEEEFDKVVKALGNSAFGTKMEQTKEHFKDWQPPQPLPVIPQFVAEWVECVKGKNNNAFALLDDDSMPDDVNEWLFFQGSDKNINLILRAWLDDYTLKNPKLFYLKNKLTTSYLALDTNTGYYEHWQEPDNSFLAKQKGYKTSFTKQEIDSMQTGSYEKIEVEE
ncbi:DUF1642 domain-containing protein [Lactococcus protaetiae]|uniref:DUF1642 domain-containing protein n=1 Tax=Lactococcus protaetiae TaxID=2592653 RepID=A0A514ZA79_9LACT|nr:DUF1642 domain-containing protein [Lactococcus protaetiae]QDK71483.1 DUF1642 domain-containing protein [Lactococcus protaetiae]